jgi:hypothetical protein
MRTKLGYFFLITSLLLGIIFFSSTDFGFDYGAICFGSISLGILSVLLLRGRKSNKKSRRQRRIARNKEGDSQNGTN